MPKLLATEPSLIQTVTQLDHNPECELVRRLAGLFVR